MSECKHDWWPMPIKYGGDADFYGAECLVEGCDAVLLETEVAERLNEHAALKREVKRLMDIDYAHDNNERALKRENERLRSHIRSVAQWDEYTAQELDALLTAEEQEDEN